MLAEHPCLILYRTIPDADERPLSGVGIVSAVDGGRIWPGGVILDAEERPGWAQWRQRIALVHQPSRMQQAEGRIRLDKLLHKNKNLVHGFSLRVNLLTGYVH